MKLIDLLYSIQVEISNAKSAINRVIDRTKVVDERLHMMSTELAKDALMKIIDLEKVLMDVIERYELLNSEIKPSYEGGE